MRLFGTPRAAGRNASSRRGGVPVWIFGIVLLLFVAAAGGAFLYRYWPRRLNTPVLALPESVVVSSSGVRVFLPNRVLIGEIAKFDDGLFAFLMFDYLRSRPSLANKTVVLTSSEEQEQPVYGISVRLPDDLIDGVNTLARLMAERLTGAIRYDWILPAKLESCRQETSVFIQAYNQPTVKRLGTLHASDLRGYLRRFIRFKSQIDPRISRALEPIPSPLTRQDASRLAADIISVAHFYDIPISLFLGGGAMENNYMNVAGDLKNTIWKRQAEEGDIVLKRKRGRVLVQNDSKGVWQITRESLRYAHRLFLNDKRDYTQLPERLRPPQKFDLNTVSTEVLTTYSGLLLRDLLDQFHGDVFLAAGAYNGGPKNPNARYAQGVEMVASYARRVIGRAAEMDRIAVERTSVSAGKIEQPGIP